MKSTSVTGNFVFTRGDIVLDEMEEWLAELGPENRIVAVEMRGSGTIAMAIMFEDGAAAIMTKMKFGSDD